MKIIEGIARNQKFYSLEFFPPKERTNWDKFFTTVDALRAIDPLFVSVTYGAGGTTQENTLGIAAKLVEKGLLPMTHLTCVGATRSKLKNYLEKLEESGITNILALRGDAPAGVDFDWSKEEFSYASDLVTFVKQEFPHFGIAVAAYPTPHPQSASFAFDRLTTKNKLEAGSDFAVTQLFFDHREYFEFVEQLARLGVTCPIVPGVLPVQSLDSLRRVLSLSGGNIPAKLYLSLEEAHKNGGIEAVREAGIVFAIEQIKYLLDGGAPGIHLYTLNQAETCLRIVEGVGKL